MFCRHCGTEAADSAVACARCGTPMGAMPGQPSPYASAPKRLAAYVIDYFIVIIALVVPCIIVAAVGGKAGAFLLVPLIFVGPWLYHALLVSSRHQGTLGKIALGIKVTDEVGRPIGFWHATGRLLAMLLSGFTMGIGYLMYFMTERRQTLHDRVAGTLVLVKEATPEHMVGSPQASRDSAWVIAALVLGFLGVAMIGIVAAIAIPAYQDYTLRSQVLEGLVLAGPAQAAVTDAVPSNSQWSRLSSESLRIPAISGKYVARVQVLSGAVVITYGAHANSLLLGKDLVLMPAIDSDRHVAWICAYAPVPLGYTPAFPNPAKFTTLPAKWLPRACRG
jgi:uncharacterized RDD family membrane protein YckC